MGTIFFVRVEVCVAYFLTIETSESMCSVALSHHARLLGEQHLDAPRQHAELVIPFVNTLLTEFKLSAQDITAIAVVVGPGAFTGIRIGVAMAKGLAYGWGKPIIPLISLEGWAFASLEALKPSTAMPIIVGLDARMGEIYGAVYQTNLEVGSTDLKILHPPTCLPIESFVQWLHKYPQACLTGSCTRLDQPKLQAMLAGATKLTAQAFSQQVCAKWQAKQAIQPSEVDALYLRPATQ